MSNTAVLILTGRRICEHKDAHEFETNANAGISHIDLVPQWMSLFVRQRVHFARANDVSSANPETLPIAKSIVTHLDAVRCHLNTNWR